MIKYIFLVLIFIAIGNVSSSAQEKVKLMKQYNFALKTKNYLEGYDKNIGHNDFKYHSLRTDVTESIISRCTDGKMSIEWLTQPIPIQHKNGGVWFSWLAAVDLSPEKHKFDVYIDDIKRFEFLSGNEMDRKFENSDGGILEFSTIDLDQHKDGHGYMSLYVPEKWVNPGKPVKIKIVGEAAGSNTWIIVFKADDVLTHLRNIAKYETWLEVSIQYSNNIFKFNINAPISSDGKELDFNIGGEKKLVHLKYDGENVNGNFEIKKTDLRSIPLIVRDENDVLIELNDLKNDIKKQKLLAESLLINNVEILGDNIMIHCERIYKPNTVKNLLSLAESNLNSGKIYLMNSSHQDIAWMDSPEKCVIDRDTMLLTPLYLKAINADPSYRFDVEDALMLKEFIERHPSKKEGIKKLLNEGKISCGSSYIQPYEEMYSGEALARQFYFGTKWLKKEFDYNARVYWNVDVPGKVLQMPQILKKAGTDYMIISRFEKGLYNWESPDGSSVITYTPGHYADAFSSLHKNEYEAANYIAASSLFWEKYYKKNSPNNVIPVLSDWDMSPANDYSHIIQNWESINEIQKEDGNIIPIRLPKFKLTTGEEFLDSVINSGAQIPTIRGERPAVWLYIHGPSHYQALKASREADILLTNAEKFSTIDALTDNSFSNYPSERLTNAWEAKIYPDHGWGGKEGQITDNLFLSKFNFARSEGAQLTENALKSIASKIVSKSEKGIPIVVFNSLNWNRSDPVSFVMNFSEGETNSIRLFDNENNENDIQFSEINNYENGSLKSAIINFIAENIPSIGYKTYYIAYDQNISKENNLNPYESKYYTIKLSNGGIQSIFDKELSKEILDVSKFKGGEVFTMRSEGNGAGEFSDIQQPTMDGFDKTSNYNSKWTLVENGPVFSSFILRQQIKNAIVEQKILLYKNIKRIDFEIALLNWEGVLFREYRMALPVNIVDGQISYETAFGAMEVGKDEIEGSAGERYTSLCKDVHPRGIENWIGVSNEEFGVTLSSSVAVADYIDPTDILSNNVILQPILLASRKSCHWEGNDYLQTGNHRYSFSLTSHPSGWKEGFEFGKEANEKLFVVINPKQFEEAILPEEKSFFSVDGRNVIISTIKKAEDNNSTIIRFYDMLGKDTNVSIKSFMKLKAAYKTNLIEDDKEVLKVEKFVVPYKLGHNSIETIRMIFSN